jgi:hypothetical protein
LILPPFRILGGLPVPGSPGAPRNSFSKVGTE